jgi:glutaredoxin
VLKDKLDIADIKYRVVSDANTLREKGVTQLPVLEVDGEMIGFAEALMMLKGAG